MDKKPIKIAQYGIGHNHGTGKMEALRAFPELFEVLGVCEPDAAWRVRRQNEKQYEGLRWLTEEEMFSLPGLEAVCVEPDVPYLNEFARRCIDRGLHIHMDKPAGEDVAGYAALLNEAKRRKLIVQLGYMYRDNPAIRYAIEQARSGALGEITQIDAVMSTWHSPEYRRWLEQYKGGTMYIFGCHLIDLILQIMGRPVGVESFLMNSAPGEDGAPDNDLAVLRYERALCTVRTSSLEVNGYGRRQLVICGTKGSIEIKPLERPTRIFQSMLADATSHYADQKRELDIPVTGGRYDRMVNDLYAMIRGEKENEYDYGYELMLQEVLMEACGAGRTSVDCGALPR